MNATSQPVVVICAMEAEAVHLRRRLDHVREKPLYAWRRTCGEVTGTPVDLIVSGIGLINAAAAAAAVCLESEPVAILNYGCAGAHRQDIDPGDVIIGDRVVHLGSYILAPDGQRQPFGFQAGTSGGRVHVDALPTDAELCERAQRMAQRLALPAWPGGSHLPRIWAGTIGSADIWTQHDDTIHTLHTTYGSLCEEMEAAAVAQVCAKFAVPFLAIKDISNNELQSRTAMTQSDADPTLLEPVRDELGLRASLVAEEVIRHLS